MSGGNAWGRWRGSGQKMRLWAEPPRGGLSLGKPLSGPWRGRSILARQAGRWGGGTRRAHFERSLEVGVLHSSLRGIKEAIKIAGRCASRLGNFQRIAFNMIGT